ncbi:WD40 repeat-like protein [Suillus brevipes Sb2]|nr:WD40 repeat-like protein [Suillus brevipes Sb2]
MHLEYQPIHSFNICGRIACLAFNQAGDMLAIGDFDARLAVASTNSSEYTDVIDGHAPVLCVTWFGNIIFAGYSTGLLLSVILGTHDLLIHGVQAHALATKFIAIQDLNLIATSGTKEVKLWRSSDGQCNQTSALPLPHDEAFQAHEVITTALQWQDGVTDAAGPALLVSYLHHGIFCWDVEAQSAIWKCATLTPIGSLDVSVDHKYLVMANIKDGVDIYEVQTGRFKMSCPRQVRDAPPLMFVHGGRALLTTDSKGCANIWSIERGSIIGTLSHGHGVIITALAVSPETTNGEKLITLVQAHYKVESDRFLIATGDDEAKMSVRIWEAQEVQDG